MVFGLQSTTEKGGCTLRNLQGFQLKELGFRTGPSVQGQATQAARQLYRHAYRSNWLVKVQSLLTRRSYCLLDLAVVRTACLLQGYENIGTRVVPLNQIVGSTSTGRCADFDTDFRPTNAHNEARWVAVATARYRQRRLPPVNLIQIGSAYFVEDGHHRISVASALGEQAIEALVTIWQVRGSVGLTELLQNPASVSLG
jgi:hypothetical protein